MSAIQRVWIGASLVVLSLIDFGPGTPLHVVAGESPAIRNLGTDFVQTDGERIAYSLRESFAGTDLNRDGDKSDSVLYVENLETDEATIIGLPGSPRELSAEWLVFEVDEAELGHDVNDDGDVFDAFLYVHEFSTGELTNLGRLGGVSLHSGRWLVVTGFRSIDFVHDLATDRRIDVGLALGADKEGDKYFGSFPSGEGLVFAVEERETGEDLNGDGDHFDDVVHVHDFSSGTTTNLEFGIEINSELWFAAGMLVFEPTESVHGVDLDGNGEIIAATVVPHSYDPVSGTISNLGFGGPLWEVTGDWVFFVLREDLAEEDFNEDGDSNDFVLHARNLETGEIANLKLSPPYGGILPVSDSVVLVAGYESARGADLNGDGDTRDIVVHVYDLAEARSTNLEIAGFFWGNSLAAASANGRVLVEVSEGHQGSDLNNDGDTTDIVGFTYELATGELTGIELAMTQPQILGDHLVFRVREGRQRADLNGDGDLRDEILHVRDLVTSETTSLALAADRFDRSGRWLVFEVSEEGQNEDLNGDGDVSDAVLFLLDLDRIDTHAPINSRIASSRSSSWPIKPLPGDRFLIDAGEMSQNTDLNGDGDMDDSVAFLIDPSALPKFARGDCNDDGTVDVSDASFTLGALFLGQRDPDCDSACDSNDDDDVNIADAIMTLGVLFLGRGTIPLPGVGECGRDPTDDRLTCNVFKGCP